MSHLRGKYLCLCSKVDLHDVHPLGRVSVIFHSLEATDLAQKKNPSVAVESQSQQKQQQPVLKQILYIGSEEKDTPADSFCQAVMSDSVIYIAGCIFSDFPPTNAVAIDMSRSIIVPRISSKFAMGNPLLVEMSGGRIYALAGWSRLSPESFFSVYDPKIKTWMAVNRKPPPFYRDARDPIKAAIVIDDQLHVSTHVDAYRFDIRKQKWKKSNIFDQSAVHRTSSALDEICKYNSARSFPFEGLGIALLDDQVLIGYNKIINVHVAFLLKDWRVVDAQFVSSSDVKPQGEVLVPPRYVDLGNGYFSIFWYEHNFEDDIYHALFAKSILNVSTYRIWLLREDKNCSLSKNGGKDTTKSQKDCFLGVEHVSSYSYPQALALDGRRVMWFPMGFFLLDKPKANLGCAEIESSPHC